GASPRIDSPSAHGKPARYTALEVSPALSRVPALPEGRPLRRLREAEARALGVDPRSMAISGRETVAPARTARGCLSPWMFRGTLRLAEKRVIHGLPVAILFPTDEDRLVVFPKIAKAFDLLDRHDRRRLARFQHDVSAVLVDSTFGGGPSEWDAA